MSIVVFLFIKWSKKSNRKLHGTHPPPSPQLVSFFLLCSRYQHCTLYRALLRVYKKIRGLYLANIRINEITRKPICVLIDSHHTLHHSFLSVPVFPLVSPWTGARHKTLLLYVDTLFYEHILVNSSSLEIFHKPNHLFLLPQLCMF